MNRRDTHTTHPRQHASSTRPPPPPPVPTDLDLWHLAAAEQLTASCKSVVLATALMRGRVTAQEALDASRLEEDYQIEDWGMVEAGHDLDIADLGTRVAAPAVMVRLLAAGRQ